jgi:hypothetical protein
MFRRVETALTTVIQAGQAASSMAAGKGNDAMPGLVAA